MGQDQTSKKKKEKKEKQTDPKKYNSAFLYLDQDFFYPSQNEDRNYTMGLSLGYANRIFEWPFSWIDKVFAEPEDQQGSILVGYGAFTPLDLASTEPVRDDRPYGGILSFRLQNIKYYEAKDISFHPSITIGFPGTSIGREFQSWVHQKRIDAGLSNRVVPEGWHNQISNARFDPTFLLGLKVKTKLSLNPNGYGADEVVDMIATGEINVGHYSNLQTGLTLRIGDTSLPFYLFDSSPNHWISEGISSVKLNSASEKTKSTFFIFGSARLQYVLYNALLQGWYASSVHTLTKNEVSDFVFAYDVGFNVGLGRANIQFQVTGRSPEYRIQTAPGVFKEGRWHYWGSVYLSYRWNGKS